MRDLQTRACVMQPTYVTEDGTGHGTHTCELWNVDTHRIRYA